MSEKRDITIDNKFGKQIVKVEIKKRRRPVYRPTHTNESKESTEAELQKKQEAIKRAESGVKSEFVATNQDLDVQKKRAFFFGDKKLLHSTIQAQRKLESNQVRTRPPFQKQQGPRQPFVPGAKRPPLQQNKGPKPPFKSKPFDLKLTAKFPVNAPKPITQVRKQVKKPVAKGYFSSENKNPSRSRTQSHTAQVQFGHKLLGKIESADDIVTDFERARSISSVRRSREKQKRVTPVDTVVREIVVFNNMPLMVLAHSMAVTVDIVLQKLREINPTATKHDRLDVDLSCLLVESFGHKYKKRIDILETIAKDVGKSDEYISRAPIVTVVGHVDHGKTSLLDALRATQFTESESGGITQSIGASQVFAHDGRFITFIDTPGHEIFTAMRARGINLTDIVLLIIAADDGIKEQTIESIQHAQASQAMIIVVITKIDKPGSNIDKIYQMLMSYDIVVESLGGNTPNIEVSAKTGHNLPELIELILWNAELLELKANPNPKASGVVLEGYLDKNCGPVATVIIKNGTLRKSDPFLSGSVNGKVRSMTDWHGKSLTCAGPSVPVQIMGFHKTPSAGDDFIVMDEQSTKEAALKRQEISSVSTFSIHKSEMAYTVDDIWKALTGNAGIMKLAFVIKADSSGSCEAIAASMMKILDPKVEISIVLKGVGAVTDSDVLLAKASNAIIIAFKIDIKPGIVKNAEVWGVKIKRYEIIYQILDDINSTIQNALAPKEEEVSIGRAEIREVFVKHKIGTIAGCFIQDGIVKRDAKAILSRNGVQIYTSTIQSIRQLRDDKREVKFGQECGIMMSKFSDYRIGDVIECFETRPV